MNFKKSQSFTQTLKKKKKRKRWEESEGGREERKVINKDQQCLREGTGMRPGA